MKYTQNQDNILYQIQPLKIHYAQLERISLTHLTKHTPNPIKLGLGHLHRHTPPLSKLSPHHHIHAFTTTYKPTQRETLTTRNPNKIINKHSLKLNFTHQHTNTKHNTLHTHRYILHTCTLLDPFPPYTNQPKLTIQTHNKKSQLNITTKHHNKKHLLLQCGDIHPNPGPMPNMLQKHPPAHRRQQNTYFLPSTIKFQPEY